MDLLDEVNSVLVTPEELDLIFEEAEEWDKEGRSDAGAGLFLVANRYRPDWKRAFAVQTRIECLMHMLNSNKARGWTLRATPEKISVRGEMIAVAATHPIIQIGKRLAFDETSFFAKVLDMTSAGGQG